VADPPAELTSTPVVEAPAPTAALPWPWPPKADVLPLGIHGELPTEYEAPAAEAPPTPSVVWPPEQRGHLTTGRIVGSAS